MKDAECGLTPEQKLDPAMNQFRDSSAHQLPSKPANSLKAILARQWTVATEISSDLIQSKVGWSVPLTLYLVCHRQSTKSTVISANLKCYLTPPLDATLPWHTIRITLLLWTVTVGYPRRTVLIRRCLLMRRRNYFRWSLPTETSLPK